MARLRSKIAEFSTGLFFALVATGMASLVFNLHPVRNISIILPLFITLAFAGYFLLENQQRNMEKFRKHPTTFPNPLGGGLIGEYMKRPWHEELAQLGRIYNKRRHKRQTRKADQDQ